MKALYAAHWLPTAYSPAVRLLCLSSLASAVLTGSLSAQSVSGQDEQTEKLNSIVVTATISESNPDNIPTTVSVIDEETIEELGAVSIDQILEEVPGLEVEMNSGRISSPKMRGTNSAQTLLMIDGRRLAPGFKRMTDLNQILASGVERIEVVRGPVSALYGSEAVGGVVNIITKKGPSKDYELHASAQAGTGNYDDWSSSLGGGASSDNFEAYGSFGVRHNDTYESGDGAPDDVDKVDLYGGFINADMQLGSSTTISGGAIGSHSKRTGLRPQSGGSLRTTIDDRAGGWIELEQRIGESTTAVIRAYAEKYKCDLTMASAKATTYSNMENTISVLDAHVTTEIMQGLSATVGGELRGETYEDDSDSMPKDEIDNSSGFAQCVWTPQERTCIIAGARVDDYDGFGTHTSPQISAMYGLPIGLNVHAGWGSGFRAPNSMELNVETYERAGKIIVEPNPNLDSESSNTFEIGIARPGKVWRIALTAFHTEVEDMIETVTIATNTKQWSNLSSVKIDGVELENTVNFNRYVSVESFFCWLNPRNDETGYHVEGEQRWSNMLALIGRMPEWQLKGRISMRFGSDEWGVNDTKSANNEVVDARIEKSFLKHWKAYIGVRDASDSEDIHYYCGVNMFY